MLIQNGSLCAVYGSLRAGLGNHRVIERSPRQADGVIEGVFQMYSMYGGGFPALTHSNTPDNIIVEVYEVNDDAQASGLDALEGYPSFYDREVVTLADGRECWVYFIDNNKNGFGDYIPSGDWKKFKLGES